MTTHEVRNQPPPFGGYDLLAGDPVLAGALDRWSPSPGDVTDLARLAATPDPARWADQADTYPPVLRTHDAVGNRLDEVDYHPATTRS
jgi:putative acyl-CoA dehydrogenase